MRNQEREKELELEKLELNKLIEFYKQQERQEKENLHQKIKNHGQDLSAQIHYNSIQRDLVNDDFNALFFLTKIIYLFFNLFKIS